MQNKMAQRQTNSEAKAALFVSYVECRNILACSVYNTKPVYMLSTITEKIDWTRRKQKGWSTRQNTIVIMSLSFFWINLIDNYNNYELSGSCGSSAQLLQIQSLDTQ
jgi:hypothetical protein